MSETDSPYPRENYFGATDDPESPRDPGEYGVGDGPDDNPGPGGTWHVDPNDPAESIAHQTLKECGELLCRATLNDPPWNGGRLGQLCAWLFDGECIEADEWALHRTNKAVPLSDPCCYPPAENASEHRHSRRVNPETGYLNWGETTGVVIPDRSFEDFMAAVNLWLARRDGELPDRRRQKALHYARRLKRQGEKSDREALKLVIHRTREKDLPDIN